MLKVLALVSTALILCSCASQQPNSESAVLASDQEGGQQAATLSDSGSELAQTQSATDGTSSAKNDDQTAPAVDPLETNSAMEVVEVEGVKEKRCTVERRTGSRIPKKYCRTVTEDKAQREAGAAWINTLKTKPQGNPYGKG